MRIKKKILLIFCITALLFLTSLGGIILYFYTHPSAVKPFIEKSISRSTGISLTIKDLSYSLKPLRIRAEGVILKPGEDLPGFHMEILDLKADISLEGPFGRKILTFNNFRIDGLSFELSKGTTLPKKMPQGKEPSFFDRILKGAIGLFLFRDIKFYAAELVRGDVTIQIADQKLKIHSIRANLNPKHLIEITCAAQMKWPSKRLSLSIPHLKITTDRAISFVEPKIGALLMAQEVTFQGPDADVKNMDVSATLTYDHNNKKLTFEPLDLHLEGVTLRHENGTKLPHLNLHLQAEGHLNLRESKLNVPHFHLTASDILKSEGNLMAGLMPQTGIELNILDCQLLPQKLMPLLPDRMKVMLTPYTLSGPVKLHGNINGLKKLEKWRWHSDLQANLKQNPFSCKTNLIQLNGLATGNIRAKGIFPEIRISAGLEGDKISLSGMGMELKPFKASLSLTGKHPAYMIKDLALHLPAAKVAMGKRDLLIDDIHLHVRKGRLDGEKRSLSLPEIRFDSSLLKNLMLSLGYDEKQVAIKIQGKQTRLIESALALNMLPSGWQFGGLDSFQISAILKEQGDYSFTSRLEFQDLGFQNQDSSCIGEKISINAEINGKIDLKGSYIAANTSLELKGGEILYDRFYIDLNKNAFFSSCKGHCDISKKSLQLSNLRLGLKDILTLDIHGNLLRKARDNHLYLSSTVPETPLKPLFHHFIQEPFQTEKPFLTDLNIGGTISADLELTGSGKNWTIMGIFRWHKGEFLLGDHDLSFQGIDLDLPIWYHHSVTSDELQVTSTKKNSSLVTRHSSLKEESIKGVLSIKSMALPLLPKQSLKLKLDASPNMLSVKSSTILRIPGGNIQLGPVIGMGLSGSRPSIETSLALDSIALKPFLSGILSQPIRGTINGRLDPVHLEGDALKCHGEIKVDVFGGEVILSDLGASGIFTAAPVVKLSARWKDLSLEEMTTGTSFGKIEGALRGHIKEMEIAYGQPQKFDLLLETVKKKGVPQKISVRAVDSIARIGGGQSPFMGLAGAFSSFFKKFPYKKIGVHASLENDVFRINGTIREGGKEYLMKRGSISGVNIVNQSTDNRISFKDMIKRIRRVTATGTRPVVK